VAQEAKTKIGRLALREEGDLWVAYYAMPDTMDGAIHLGSIRMAIVLRQTERKSAFMALMRDAVSDLIFSQTGQRVGWTGPERAPEYERAGRA